MSIPKTLTLKDWEASRERQKQGFTDIPLTDEEKFEEKIGKWHSNRKMKRLAESIYEGRMLEMNDGKDRVSLREAETVLSYMKTESVKPISESSGKISRDSAVSEMVSLSDMKRLKENRLQAAKQAAEQARAAVEAEAANFRNNSISSFRASESPESHHAMENASKGVANSEVSTRPKSAPGLRRSLEVQGNLLNAARRHNASRFHLEPADSQTFFKDVFTNELALVTMESKTKDLTRNGESGTTVINTMASRTQDERFRTSQPDTFDAQIGPRIETKEQNCYPKTIDIAKFEKKQGEWLENVEKKRDEIKREVENAQIRELRSAPDIKLTADSWQRAKKEHALEAERQARLDEKQMEFKLMKQQLKNQSLKGELIKVKLSKTRERKRQSGIEVITGKCAKTKRVARKSKASIGIIEEEVIGNDTYQFGRHDPDVLCLSFDAVEDGKMDGKIDSLYYNRTSKSSGSNMRPISRAVPTKFAICPPEMNSLDLISAVGESNFATTIGRRAHSARSRSSTTKKDWGMNAMATLGGDLILDSYSSVGADVDRQWLESIMRKRKEDQLRKEAQFEMELAGAMGSAIKRNNGEQANGMPAMAYNSAESKPLHTLNAPFVHKAIKNTPQPQREKAEDRDILYLSDTDDDSVIMTTPRLTNKCATENNLPSTSDKLDALITDLDSLRGTLEKRITSSVSLPEPTPAQGGSLSRPSSHSLPETASVSATSTIAISINQVTPPQTQRIEPPTTQFSSIVTSAEKNLCIDIPESAFLLANVSSHQSPRKQIKSDTHNAPNLRVLTTAALNREENSLLSGVELKIDPLTEELLSRTAPLVDQPSRTISQPRTSQLLTTNQIRENQELRERSNRELVTPLTRFFDSSSTADKGRFRLHDARDYVADSMFRKQDILNDAVTLLFGKRKDNGAQQIITILFDRADFSETKAREWWLTNRDRLLF